MNTVALDNAKKIFVDFYKNYDLSRWLPFFHGTSVYDHGEMKKSGFLAPRGERSSTWSVMPSKRNLVYFAACGETQIPSKSAYNAVESSAWRYFEKKRLELSNPKQQVYLKLENVDKYIKHATRDEDDSFLFQVSNSVFAFSIDVLESKKRAGEFVSLYGLFFLEEIPYRCLEVIWHLGDRNEVLNIVRFVPDHVGSLYTNGTLAFKTSIDINDLSVLERGKAEFYEIGNECTRFQHGKKVVGSKEFHESKLIDDICELATGRRYVNGVLVYDWEKNLPSILSEYGELHEHVEQEIVPRFNHGSSCQRFVH